MAPGFLLAVLITLGMEMASSPLLMFLSTWRELYQQNTTSPSPFTLRRSDLNSLVNLEGETGHDHPLLHPSKPTFCSALPCGEYTAGDPATAVDACLGPALPVTGVVDKAVQLWGLVLGNPLA